MDLLEKASGDSACEKRRSKERRQQWPKEERKKVATLLNDKESG